MRLKYWLLILGVVTLALTGCTREPATPTAPTEAAPSPTPAAALTLPALMGTPVPLPAEPITPDSVDRLQLLAMWGNGQVKDVTYSSDGTTLAIGTTAGVGLYDAQTLQVRRFIQANSSIVTMALWPDDQLVAYQEDNTISCWHTNTGELGGHWQVGEMAVFSPNAQKVVAMLANGQIALWQ
jgi:WD40 repeat protein